MSPIPEGTKVRISYEATYRSPGRNVHWVDGGDGFGLSVPNDAEIEVVEEPLPEEPEIGSYVVVSRGSPRLFRRESRLTTGDIWREGWYRVTDPDHTYPFTWKEIQSFDTVTRLVPEGDQYEPALSGQRGHYWWRHRCGNVATWDQAVQPGGCGACLGDSDWAPLYQRSTGGADTD